MNRELLPSRRLVQTWVVLAVLDGLVLGQGALALVAGVVIVIRGIVGWLRAAKSRESLARAGIVIALGVLLPVVVVGTISLDARFAARRADAVVAAVHRYHDETGAWPGRLQELCPRYLAGVPLARWRAMHNDFVYVVIEDRPMLWYVVAPPFLKRTYRFVDRSWDTSD